MFGRVNFREDGKKKKKEREIKWGDKFIWKVFGWEGREDWKWWWGLDVFSPIPWKSFLSKIGRKLSEGSLLDKWQKCLCALAHGLV